MKIRHKLGQLQGRTLTWAEAYLSANPLDNISFENTEKVMKSI